MSAEKKNDRKNQAAWETIDVAAEKKKNKEKSVQKQLKDQEKQAYAEKLEAWFSYAWEHGYRLSESRLAKEIGVAQKSMNRYRNGQTLPNEEVQKKLEDYFSNLKEEIDEEEQAQMRDRLLEYYDDEPEDEQEEACTQAEYARTHFGVCSDGLSVYTPETQQFIVDHFELLWMVERHEIELIEKYRMLDALGKQKIRTMLESVPVSLAMVQADGRGKQSGNAGVLSRVRPRILGVGSHRWLEVTCRKNDLYHRFLQCKELPPQQTFNELDLEQDGFCRISDPKLQEKFDEQCIEYGHELYMHRNSGFSEEDVPCFYERMIAFHHTYYDNLNKLLKFTTEEWYLLYLLTRMQIADFEDSNMIQVFEVRDDYHVQERESMLWTYLDMLAK